MRPGVPRPQAFGPSPITQPAKSPWVKGNAACRATSFISHVDALRGLDYLAAREDTGPFVEVIDLSASTDPRIAEVLDAELGDGFSSGLPMVDGYRERVPLHLIKVTAPGDAQLVDGSSRWRGGPATLRLPPLHPRHRAGGRRRRTPVDRGPGDVGGNRAGAPAAGDL